ncbi:uncharacterized protein LOC144874100 [Branchiostoma floridae x Branchiostoma japonicum]
MEKKGHLCTVCNQSFSQKSNLTRHMKLHGTNPNAYTCDVCGKGFTQKQHLTSHLKQHQYPNIRQYKDGVAKVAYTEAAKTVLEAPNKEVDRKWLDCKTAEAAARKSGGEMWKGQIHITFGKFAGQSFRWLLENAVGYVVWLMSQYLQEGEKNELLKWQKERMLEYVRQFPPVSCLLDKRLEVR